MAKGDALGRAVMNSAGHVGLLSAHQWLLSKGGGNCQLLLAVVEGE